MIYFARNGSHTYKMSVAYVYIYNSRVYRVLCVCIYTHIHMYIHTYNETNVMGQASLCIIWVSVLVSSTSQFQSVTKIINYFGDLLNELIFRVPHGHHPNYTLLYYFTISVPIPPMPMDKQAAPHPTHTHKTPRPPIYPFNPTVKILTNSNNLFGNPLY